MLASQAIDHYREVIASEITYFTDTYDCLAVAIDNLPTTAAVLQTIVHNKSLRSSLLGINTAPRLSHMVLESTYGSLFSETPITPARKTQALALIGNVLMPLNGFRPTIAAPGTLINKDGKGSCDDAEAYFSDCITQVNTGQIRSQPIISVYHDPTGVPLLLRKSHKVSTGLTLQPISFADTKLHVVNSVKVTNPEVPEGSIVDIDQELTDMTSSGVRSKKGFMLKTYQVVGPLA